MKTNRLITLLTASLIALVSCDNKYETDFVPKALREFDYNTVEFSVLASDLTHEDVNVIVKHNGPADLKWYGFLNEGSTTDIDALVAAKLNGLKDEDVHIGASQTVRLTSLKDNRVYQYVAFGIGPDNKVCGKAGDLVFTTDIDKAKVTFTVEASNISYTTADITVAMNDANESFTWYGVVTTDINADDKEIASAAAKTVKAGDLYSGLSKTISLDALSFGTEYKYVAFGVDENNALYGTPGSVKFTTESYTFSPKSEWTVSYDGIGEDKLLMITNTSSEQEIGYKLVTVDASSFAENTESQKIVAQAAGKAIAQLKAEKKDGVSYKELLKYGTSTESLKLSYGSYYAVAVGFDDKGNITGDYAISEIFEYKDTRTPYEKWLGTWSYSAAGSDFEITVTQKVVNSTYTITGFTGEYPIEAGFDPETGSLFINGGQVLADGYEIQTDSGTAVTTLYLYGLDSDDYVEHGNPDKNLRLVLGTLDKDANTAKFEGDVYDAVYSGNTWHEVIVSFGIFAVTAENKYYSLRDYTHTNLPGTLTRTGNGDNPDGGDNPGKVSYESWLGNWTYSSAESNRSITISQKKANSSYMITGFTGEYPIEATYEASTGGINIAGMQKLDSSVQLSEDLTVDMYLFGVDSNNSLAVGNPDKGYRLVFGKLGSDGNTASFEGDEYDDEYEGEVTHEEIVLFGLFAVTPDFSDLYTLNDSPLVDLPGTLTKAGVGVARKSAGRNAVIRRRRIHDSGAFTGKYQISASYKYKAN